MNIAVCIKQVPVSDKVKMDPITHNLLRENTEMDINVADMNALTEAIHMKEKTSCSIHVYTMGSEKARSVLYKALAMGADQAYLVTDRAFAGGDSLATAKVLAAALNKGGPYDLILCGAIASDGATGQVGPMLAQLMELPSVTEGKKLAVTGEDKMEVFKSWKGRLHHMEITLPALCTVALGSNTPILPTLRNQMKAKKREIHILTNQDLNLEAAEIGLIGARSLVTETKPAAWSGKHSKMLQGSLEDMAEETLKLLREARG